MTILARRKAALKEALQRDLLSYRYSPMGAWRRKFGNEYSEWDGDEEFFLRETNRLCCTLHTLATMRGVTIDALLASITPSFPSEES